MESLIHLPLTTLDFDSMSLDAITSLPRFSGLRTLDLEVDQSVEVRAEASAFMMHLTRCKLLTALTLHWCAITADDLAQLSAALTALTSLRFVDSECKELDHPDALSYLCSLSQLRELQFLDSTGVRLVHLTDPGFAALSSLRRLDVSLFGADLQEARDRSLLTLPWPMMPQLEHCNCTHNGD